MIASNRKERIMTGSLQIKNSKYYAVLNLTDTNGKRKQKWISSGLDVKGNKKKADKFLRDKIQEYELQENIIPSEILFSDYISKWLEKSKLRLDTITYQGYSSIAKLHIIPYFKEKRIKLNNLNRSDIQEYVDIKSVSGKIRGSGGLSPKSIHTHMIIIQQVLKEAVKSNLLLNNPYQYISLPKIPKHTANFYSYNDLQILFDTIKDEPLYPLIFFTVVFGLRRSEVLGLKWDSIDFERGLITIKHTVVRYNNIVEKDKTKTEASYRSYPLIDEVKTILLHLIEKENEYKQLFGKEYIKNDYIFKWENGKPFAPDYITSKFEKLLKKNGLRKIRFHDLRHSCASLLVAKGFQLKDIQEWLGHADIQTTANIYAHLDVERKNKIADSMAKSFNF